MFYRCHIARVTYIHMYTVHWEANTEQTNEGKERQKLNVLQCGPKSRQKRLRWMQRIYLKDRGNKGGMSREEDGWGWRQEGGEEWLDQLEQRGWMTSHWPWEQVAHGFESRQNGRRVLILGHMREREKENEWYKNTQYYEYWYTVPQWRPETTTVAETTI